MCRTFVQIAICVAQKVSSFFSSIQRFLKKFHTYIICRGHEFNFKKTLLMTLATIFIFSVSLGVSASSRAADMFTFDGTCKRTFITDGKLILLPGTFSEFHVYLTEITEGYTHAHARPVGPNGATYGSKLEITLGDTSGTSYTPKDEGMKAKYAHAKIYNPLYEAGTSSSTSIRIIGKVTVD